MIFHHLMHFLTLHHQRYVATLGGMPSPFVYFFVSRADLHATLFAVDIILWLKLTIY